MNGPAQNNPQFLPPLRMSDQYALITSVNENIQPSLKWPKIPGTSSKRRVPYKTEVCLKFQRGYCNYGDHCHFAHGIGDLHGGFVPNPPRSNVQLCWSYSDYGECPYGDRCHYFHQKGARKVGGLDRASVAISILNGGGQPGGDRRGGFGDLERLRKGKVLNAGKPAGWKTRICNRWETTGSCSYGLSCLFAHGKSELQKRGSGIAPQSLSTSKRQVLGKQWVFKWNDVEKISRIYADWIPNMPVVHGSSGTMGS